MKGVGEKDAGCSCRTGTCGTGRIRIERIVIRWTGAIVRSSQVMQSADKYGIAGSGALLDLVEVGVAVPASENGLRRFLLPVLPCMSRLT